MEESSLSQWLEERSPKVYERFKHKADEQWKKLQETPIRKSSAAGSRETIEEQIVVKALDKFLTPLSAKEELEMKTGQNIPPFLFMVLTNIDGSYNKEELLAMCQEKSLPVSGDKKTLALRLLKCELGKTTISMVLLFSAPAHRHLDLYPPTNLPQLPLLKYQPRHLWPAGFLFASTTRGQRYNSITDNGDETLSLVGPLTLWKIIVPNNATETTKLSLAAPSTLPEYLLEVAP